MNRRLPMTGGLVALALAWLGPLPGRVEHSFTAHMSMHVIVVAVAAPLIAAALAGSRCDPSIARPMLFAALPASLLEWLVVWGWHAPALHALSQHSPAALALEQGSFLAVGLLLWVGALGGDPAKDGHRAATGVIALLLTSMHMTLLGALLALSPRMLYGHHGSLDDLRMGGLVMLAGGGSAYLLGGLALLGRLMRGRSIGTSGAPT